MRIAKLLFTVFLVGLAVYSYAYVDSNFPLPKESVVWNLVATNSTLKLFLYIFAVGIMYSGYVFFLKKTKSMSSRSVWQLVFLTTSILVLSFPAFSYDIFNYIATARVAFFYGENPYVVMPIELTHEPMLSFMHAANKTAFYGPSWILLTAVPHFAGLGNLFATIFTFKLFVNFFYLGTCYLIWLLSKRNLTALILFAFNPLVIIETLVSGHNDIVMMFFVLLSFYLLPRKLFIFSIASLAVSVLIKYATLVLLPLYMVAFIRTIKNKNVPWDKVWFYGFLFLLLVFMLSPTREEMYSWYFIWPFTFLVLTRNNRLLKFISVAFSLGLLLRFAPFIYFRTWEGLTPVVKEIVTWSSLALGILLYVLFRKKYL